MKAFSLLSLTVIMTASVRAGDIANAVNGLDGDVGVMAYQQSIDRAKQETKDDLAQYVRYQDEFERLFPLKVPQEPKFIDPDNPAFDRLNLAMAEDYEGRVARYNLRVAAYREAKR